MLLLRNGSSCHWSKATPKEAEQSEDKVKGRTVQREDLSELQDVGNLEHKPVQAKQAKNTVKFAGVQH